MTIAYRVYPLPVISFQSKGVDRKIYPQITDGWHDEASEHRSKPHRGVDLMYYAPDSGLAFPRVSASGKFIVPSGVMAYAVADGKVVAAKADSHGHYVMIDHGKNEGESTYRHLTGLLVGVGMRVDQWTPLGLVGEDPANPRDPVHLHFELSRKGERYDPTEEIKYWPRLNTRGEIVKVPYEADPPEDTRWAWFLIGGVLVARQIGVI